MYQILLINYYLFGGKDSNLLPVVERITMCYQSQPNGEYEHLVAYERGHQPDKYRTVYRAENEIRIKAIVIKGILNLQENALRDLLLANPFPLLTVESPDLRYVYSICYTPR